MTDVRDSRLITFALSSYNQESYIREAVEGDLCTTSTRCRLPRWCFSRGNANEMRRKVA